MKYEIWILLFIIIDIFNFKQKLRLYSDLAVIV